MLISQHAANLGVVLAASQTAAAVVGLPRTTHALLHADLRCAPAAPPITQAASMSNKVAACPRPEDAEQLSRHASAIVNVLTVATELAARRMDAGLRWLRADPGTRDTATVRL